MVRSASPPTSPSVKALRVATLSWPRDEHGVSDYANPSIIPLAVPREELVFPPLDTRTHRPCTSPQT